MCKQCIWIRMLFLSHIEHLRTLSVSLVHTLYEWHSSDVCWWCHRYLRLQVSLCWHELSQHLWRHWFFTIATAWTPFRQGVSLQLYPCQRLSNSLTGQYHHFPGTKIKYHYIWITNVLFEHYDNSHFMAKWNKSLGLPTQNTGCPQPYLFVVLVPAVFQQMAVNHE